MALGSTQPLTNEYQEYFLGGKGGRCVRLTTLPTSCAVVTISGNLNFLEPSGAVQACNGTAYNEERSSKHKVSFLFYQAVARVNSCRFLWFKLSLDNWMPKSSLALDSPGILTITSIAVGRIKLPSNLCWLRNNSLRYKKGFLLHSARSCLSYLRRLVKILFYMFLQIPTRLYGGSGI